MADQPTEPHRPDPTLAYEPPQHAAGPLAPFPVPSPAPSPAGGGYGAPAHPVPPPPPVAPMAANEQITWGVAAHLSGFVAAYVALGFLGPLVVLLTGGRRSAFVRGHAVEALNFNLTVLIALFASVLLMLLLVGFVLLPLVGIGYLVFTIRGALAASRGEEFRYPMTIRFVR